jgi:hypothetical protein
MSLSSDGKLSREKRRCLSMTDTKAEIARVEKALAETKSQKLKNDYQKYLKKLYRRLKRGE